MIESQLAQALQDGDGTDTAPEDNEIEDYEDEGNRAGK